MNTKICTSIDQSKKLLSLGLDPSTADMGWNIFVDGTIRLLPIDDWDLSKDGSNNVKLCYAWSLAALLELMPVNIMNYNNGTYKNYSINLFRSYYHCCGYYFGPSLKEENEDLLCCFGSKESWIDAIYKTVIWCIEQGHIKINK